MIVPGVPSSAPPLVELPRVTGGAGAPPTVVVPLPQLPVITPSARVCVLLACIDLG